MRTFTQLAILCAGAFAAVSAHAGNADICFGPTQPVTALVPATNSTVFTCPQAGNKTIPQLAADGWKIVQLGPISLNSTQGADQLIIERP